MDERYSRQVLFPPIGRQGQKKLSKSKAVLIGAGGLGSVTASCLVRSGIGSLKIIDKDFLEISNLQRQILYDETDLNEKKPKAFIAKEKLEKINSKVKIEGINLKIDSSNIHEIIKKADIVLDGTDNFETRYLINKACIDLNIPWIFGSAASSCGMVYPIIPSITPCFKCIFHEIPKDIKYLTSENSGVLNTVINIVASVQATEAIKFLINDTNSILSGLLLIDVWNCSFKIIRAKFGKDYICKECGYHYVFS